MMELDEYAIKPMRYFSHDANARDDQKCRRLKRKYGMAGYGRWWQLCEVLASCDGHFLATRTDDDWELVADYLEFPTVEETKDFIESLKSLMLIEPDSEHIWSKRMNDNAVKVSANKRNGVKGAAERWGK